MGVGLQVTLNGAVFDAGANVIVDGTLVSGPPELRTLAILPDGTAEEVRCTEAACIAWEQAAVEAVLLEGSRRRHRGAGRRLFSAHHVSSRTASAVTSSHGSRDHNAMDVWRRSLGAVVSAYTRARFERRLRPLGSSSSQASSTDVARHLVHERMSLPHRLTAADRHVCGQDCVRRRRRADEAGAHATGHVAVQRVPSGRMKDTKVLSELSANGTTFRMEFVQKHNFSRNGAAEMTFLPPPRNTEGYSSINVVNPDGADAALEYGLYYVPPPCEQPNWYGSGETCRPCDEGATCPGGR